MHGAFATARHRRPPMLLCRIEGSVPAAAVATAFVFRTNMTCGLLQDT